MIYDQPSVISSNQSNELAHSFPSLIIENLLSILIDVTPDRLILRIRIWMRRCSFVLDCFFQNAFHIRIHFYLQKRGERTALVTTRAEPRRSGAENE